MIDVKVRRNGKYLQVDLEVDNFKIDYGLLNNEEAFNLGVALMTTAEELLPDIPERQKLIKLIEKLNEKNSI